MPSDEDYGSDYDTRPEAGRAKPHSDSDESDNERSSSGPRRRLPFLHDDADDDYDDSPMVPLDETKAKPERSSPSTISAPSSAPAASNTIPNPKAILIRQPTAFPAPASAVPILDPATTSSSSSPGGGSGPTFYHNNNNNNHKNAGKTPTHAAVLQDGTSVFHVEGYVNTPELSAGRGGGLSQGLPANGPYKSLFRARSESRCGSGKTATATAAAAAAAGTAPDAGLHVLADAAQSPEAQSPVSAASPAPARTPVSVSAPSPAPAPAPPSAMSTSSSAPRKRRKPSPLVPCSHAPSVASLGSVISVAQPRPLLSSASSSLVADPSLLQPPPPRGRIGKSKHREHREKAAPASATAPPRPPAWAIEDGHEQRYERRSFSGPITEPHHESGSVVRARSRSMQKNRAASQEMPSVSSPTAPANGGGGYDHSREYYPSGYDAELPDVSNITVHAADEGVRVQSLSPPPKKWESPRPSPPVINHYPASSYATSKEPSPAHATEERPLTPAMKSRMLTLLIEDRRNGTDELAEVHVPLKIAGEGYLWADAKDVCAALQSGPSRIDGPARVLTMRGKYRQTFLRVSADGEETTQSANLKVETNRTLSIIVEDISDPRVVMPPPFLTSDPGSLVGTRPATPTLNPTHLLTPLSNSLDLDGMHATSPSHKEVGQWSGGARKRKRRTSLGHVQQSSFNPSESHSLTNAVDASATRTMSTAQEHYLRLRKKPRRSDAASTFDSGYMSDSPSAAYRGQRAQRKDSEARLHRSGYETDQPLRSVHARMSRGTMAPQERHQSSGRGVCSLLVPPPTPLEGSQRMHDKTVSFLQDNFVEDRLNWNEFARDRAHVGSLSNVALLRIYWFAQGQLDTWVGSKLPKHLNYKKVETGHVLDALGVTEDWYRECNETLSLVIAYGERGKRGENARAVAASRDRAPKSRVVNSGPTELLAVLREAHEEYCETVRGRIGQGRESSIE